MPGKSGWDQRSRVFMRTHMLFLWCRVAWIELRAVAESCSLTTWDWSCRKCCACLSPEDVLPFWSGVRSSSDSSVAIVLRLVHGAQMPPQARTMFRFASHGSLAKALRAAGFCNVREEWSTVPRIWSGTPEELWEYQQEISTLCHP